MNNTAVAYCRLCAVLKPLNKLTNLENDEETAVMILNKLSRLNIIMNFNGSILPKTVCCGCTRSLNQAHTFISTVEKAQATLSDYILVKIKMDDTESDDKNIFYEAPSDIKEAKVERIDNYNVEIKHDDVNNLEDINNISIINDNHNSVKYEINSTNDDHNLVSGDENQSIRDCTETMQKIVKDPNVSNQYYIQNNEHRTDIETNQGATITIVKSCNVIHKSIKRKLAKDSNLVTVEVPIIKNQNVSQNATAKCKENGMDLEETKNLVTPPKVKRKYMKCKSAKDDSLVSKPEEKTEYSTQYINTQIERFAAIPLQGITKTWMDYHWKCYFCETLFPNIQELRNHAMEYHDCCNPYMCPEGCQGRKFRLNRFLKHLHHHKKYLHYSCYVCFEKFSNPLQTRKHKRTHINTEFTCQGCNTSFPSKVELSTHETKYFQKIVRTPLKEQDFSCNVCEKVLTTRSGFLYHMDAHKTDRKRQYVCDICGKGYLGKSYLADHIIHHFDARPYQCVICKQSFKTYIKLRYHARVHSELKPFKCDQCGKCFRLKMYLTKHLITHSDDLPFSCKVCYKKFRTSTFLKNHNLQHTGVRPYTCEICQRKFTNWSNYNKHMKRKHGIDKTKRKRTPQGPHAVDPATGEIIYPETGEALEWQKKMNEPKPMNAVITKKVKKTKTVQSLPD